jgi:hypothetical protein
MKFTTTENTTWRQGVGKIPKPWIEYTFKPYEDYEDVYRSSIMEYYYDHIKCWDFDICGSETHDFVFEDGKAFRLEYSWWAEWYHDNDEENGLKDEYYIEEITLEEANVSEKKIRDWL